MSATDLATIGLLGALAIIVMVLVSVAPKVVRIRWDLIALRILVAALWIFFHGIPLLLIPKKKQRDSEEDQ